MFLSPHMHKEDLGDFNEFRRTLRRSDIYIPESITWNQSIQLAWDAVSKGDREIYKEVQTKVAVVQPAWFALFEAAYASNRKIVLIDIPEGNDLANEITPHTYLNEYFPLDFEEMLLEESKISKKQAIAELKRDEFMLTRIGPALEAAIAEQPKLSAKEQVNVFMSYGSLHKPMYEVLRKLTEDQRKTTSSSLPRVHVMQPNYEYSDQASILIAHFHPFFTVSLSADEEKNLQAQAFTVNIIQTLTSAPAWQRKFICMAVSNLSMAEMGDVYQFVREADNTGKAFPPVFEKIGSLIQSAIKHGSTNAIARSPKNWGL
jgi:hypothetical protein